MDNISGGLSPPPPSTPESRIRLCNNSFATVVVTTTPAQPYNSGGHQQLCSVLQKIHVTLLPVHGNNKN